MPNLDLNILNIIGGDTTVLKVMQGDSEVYPNLPYDAEVEYLQGDGTAYIELDLKPYSATSIEITFQTLATGTQFAFGVYGNSSAPASYSLFQQSSDTCLGIQYYSNQGTYRLKSSVVGTSGQHTLKMDNGSFYVDGSLIGTITNTFVCNVNAYLFKSNGQSIAGELNMYRCKISNDGRLFYDFIPVRVGQVGYLYDKVTKQLFGNANSSGAFTFGNDV